LNSELLLKWQSSRDTGSALCLACFKLTCSNVCPEKLARLLGWGPNRHCLLHRMPLRPQLPGLWSPWYISVPEGFGSGQPGVHMLR
jgi:hypothetical protein